ncbi:ABC-type Fe3+ transport system, substrate-binding protein [Abditibacterium utsteinense]|uniref:ABC-type Fe3+ transport system, substrate-binding protein n=1 Tax=Abditibacterium utsteinense TaxID=1960156 RepID=A0A2S8SVU6_9BACT|nr:extracellular solute-binding protein [Abditibacterium utsteinense]PQV64915.1 ABC-type Fe3+ transport system, substrate-binding protein [Abditibacterium utsteinense]
MNSFRFFPLIGLGLLAAGCASQTQSASNGGSATKNEASQVLTIISPHTREIQVEFTDLWKSQNPGSDIKWLDQGGTSDDLGFVRQQFAGKDKTKGIGIDLFFGGGGETFTELEKDGLLAPLSSDYSIPAQLNGVPLRGKNNSWVAAALSGFGILYNKQIAARDKLPIPQSWEGLTDPKLRDRIELADPRHSGSAHTAYEIILQSNGWDKGWKILTAMTGNARTFATNGGAPLQDVQNGEAVFCPSIDFYARSAIKKAGNEKLGYISPQGQDVVTADPIALLPGAPNAQAAKKFVQMVMSPAGQKLWFTAKGSAGGPKNSELFRLPALPASYTNGGASGNPYQNRNSAKYDAEKASIRRRALDDLIGSVLIDNHDAVKAAWQKNPSLEATGYVPLSEAEFMKIAVQWNKPEFVSATQEKWASAAVAKFGG